ncbi:helix-turn-helix domain-containing protein [Weissella viridescens]|uniref:helix-turn-helix domain-containing protein n=1 Tax=Weissella viridescens TaxID=1629 RepID=UPI003AF2C802
MTFFERTRDLAKQRGMNLKQVAQKASLSENALYRYNQGINPKYPTVKAVADVLGVSVDYLLGNTDEMHPTDKNPQDMNSVELEEALRGEGASLRFEGKELSDEYKRMILDILQNLK